MHRAWLVALVALTGCYAEPDGLSTDAVITVGASALAAPADGAAEVMITVGLVSKATPGTLVTLRTSGGQWLGGEPTGTGSVTVPIPAGGDDDGKRLTLPLRMDRTPGTVRVEAEVAGYVARTSVEAEAAGPDALFGEADVVRLAADGRSVVHLRFDFDRAEGKVSQGTPLTLAACCVQNDRPVACGFRAPLRVPSRRRIEGDDAHLMIDAVAEQLTATEVPAGTLAVEVVARVGLASPTCADPGDDPTAVRVPLTLTVQD